MEAAANERKRKIKNIYFKRTLLNWPIYEAYIYQFRIRYLIKRVFSTIKPLGNFIKDVERRYKIKL
jgi:hypothetical protein